MPIQLREERRERLLAVALERRAEELERARAERIARTMRVSRVVDVHLGHFVLTQSGHCFKAKGFDTREEVFLGHVAYLAADCDARAEYVRWLNE